MLDSNLELRLKFLFFFFLVILASVISSSMSLDSIAYHNILEMIRNSSNFYDEIKHNEIFFLFLAKILATANDFFWFLFVSIISVSLKLCLIEKTSRSFWLSSFFYASYFFVLFDGTQIRSSLAIIIAFWGGYFISERKFLLSLLIISFSALFFHYSLAFFLISLLFYSRRTVFILVLLWPVLIVSWFFDFHFIHVLVSSLSPVTSNWIGLGEFKRYLLHLNKNAYPYSSQFIIMYLTSIFVYYKYKDELNGFEIFCFNCLFFSFVMLGLFVGVDAVANRLSEIFRFGIVFVIPLYYRFLLELVKNKWCANFFFSCALVGYFCFYVIHAGLIVWPKG